MDERGAGEFNRDIIELHQSDLLGQEYYDVPNNYWALVRAQVRHEASWILKEIRRNIGYTANILVMGCGPGFLSNELAKAGHNVTAIDFSLDELRVAERRDETRRVRYLQADIYKLPFETTSFDVVAGLDLFEHMSNPDLLLKEASRVLHPGGLFFFNAHNKNPLSYFFSIRGPEYLVPDAKRHQRVYALFSHPKKIGEKVESYSMELERICGLRPVLFQKALWQMLAGREVTVPFKYTWSRFTLVTYLGYAKKFREH